MSKARVEALRERRKTLADTEEAKKKHIIELCKSNGKLRILLSPPHPPLSPDYGGEDKGEGDCGITIFLPLFMQKSIIRVTLYLIQGQVSPK